MSDAARARRLTLFVALLSMVGPFSIDTYLPSFPDIEAEFGVDRAVLAQSLGVYLAAFAVTTLIWGPLADRFGRRPVVFASLIGYALASLGCAFAQDATQFLALRMLQGLFASGGMIAGRAMIRDAHQAEAAHRAMSQVTLVFAIAPAVAPILGGWLHDLAGWRSVFAFLAALGVGLFALALTAHETLPADHRQSIHPVAIARGYGQVLRHRVFLARVGALGAMFAGVFLFIAGAPTVLYDFLHLPATAFGVQFVPMVAGMMAGSALSARLAHRWPVARTVSLGFGVMAVAAVLQLASVLTLPASPVSVIGPLVAYAFGLATAMPALTVLALDCFPKNRGMAAAGQGFVQMMVNAAAASLVVPLVQSSLTGFALGLVTCQAIALGLWWGVGRHDA